MIETKIKKTLMIGPKAFGAEKDKVTGKRYK